MDTSTGWNLYDVRNSQEWALRFGTGFAFLVQSMFAAAVNIALQQRIWVATKKRPITIGGLDAMFSAAHSLLSFTSMEFLRKAKLGAGLALLVWLIPLSAPVSPATPTVIPSTTSNFSIMPVPAIDFNKVPPLYDSSSNELDLKTSGASTDNGIRPYLSRIISATASTHEMPPLNQAIPNSTYQLEFNGPSLRCRAPSTAVDEAIKTTLNATWFIATRTNMTSSFRTDMAWLAFTPTKMLRTIVGNVNNTNPILNNWLDFLNYAATCIITPIANKPVPEAEEIPFCEGIVTVENATLESVSTEDPNWPDYNRGQIWVWAQNETYECILTDTAYDVRFSYSLSENVQRVDPNYSFEWTTKELYGSYFPITNALADLLGGAIRGYYSGILSYKTRVSETVIFSAFRASPNPWSDMFGLDPVLLPPDITALARNKSAGELLEELSRNVTLSMFNADEILNPTNTEVNVNITISVNKYSYNKQTLILTYSITFGLSLLGILVGITSYVQNGVSYDNSFSVFMLTTRNDSLDGLSRGHSIGSMPLDNTVRDTKLMFRLLAGKAGV